MADCIGTLPHCWHGIVGRMGGPYTCCKCKTVDGSDLPAPTSTDVLQEVDATLAQTFEESLRRAQIQRIADDLARKQRERGELI